MLVRIAASLITLAHGVIVHFYVYNHFFSLSLSEELGSLVKGLTVYQHHRYTICVYVTSSLSPKAENQIWALKKYCLVPL